ncbi:hypothetical protein [Polynucleobacter sp. UK-Kesae-W10]|nr:hypothetical protein [Polynucleobacter sp. UK-Kesae-W10]
MGKLMHHDDASDPIPESLTETVHLSRFSLGAVNIHGCFAG